MTEVLHVFETLDPPAAGPVGEVVDLPGRDTKYAAVKWGEALDGGFQIVPDLIFRHQRDLKLTANDMLVLLHLMMAWWDVDRPPFIRLSTIARRMGASERTVQRSINRISKQHLFKRTKTKDIKNEWRQAFDLTPLVNRLNEIALTDLITERRRTLRTEAAGVQTRSPAQAQ